MTILAVIEESGTTGEFRLRRQNDGSFQLQSQVCIRLRKGGIMVDKWLTWRDSQLEDLSAAEFRARHEEPPNERRLSAENPEGKACSPR